MGYHHPPPKKRCQHAAEWKKYFQIKSIDVGFYDVFSDDAAKRSAIAAQLTTEIAMCFGTKGKGHSQQT